MTEVELKRVSVTFGHKVALKPVSATLSGGTSVALVGSNGSGKTTMLRLLAGLLEPTKGTIEPKPLPTVGYVAQHQHQHDWMPLTVAEVLIMGRYRDLGLLKRPRAADRALVDQAAARLGVDDLLDEAFGTLSGGQRQRVLVAAALVSDGELLLLDEPITGLDIPSQQRILDVIGAEKSRGRLVVISTHHLEEARRCDRVILLRNEIIADGAPTQALNEAALRETFGTRVLSSGGPALVFDDHGHGHDH